MYGRDGIVLLDAVFDANSPAWLRKILAVETLWQVWIQQYYCENNKARWRT